MPVWPVKHRMYVFARYYAFGKVALYLLFRFSFLRSESDETER